MKTVEECAQIIKSIFDPYITIPLENWIRFTRHGKIVTAPKNSVLKEPHSTERYLRFLLCGSGGLLSWNANNYVCYNLVYENEFFCDYISFRQQEPSDTEIRLFEDAEMLRISVDQFMPLVNSSRGEKLLRIIAEAHVQDQQERQKTLLTSTARERYEQLVEGRPDVLDRIPHKYLASYLGITPQSLSRIRNQ